MAFFKHRYEVQEVTRETKNGWSSAIVRYIGDDEREANLVYKKLKEEHPEKKFEIQDYVWF